MISIDFNAKPSQPLNLLMVNAMGTINVFPDPLQ